MIVISNQSPSSAKYSAKGSNFKSDFLSECSVKHYPFDVQLLQSDNRTAHHNFLELTSQIILHGNFTSFHFPVSSSVNMSHINDRNCTINMITNF